MHKKGTFIFFARNKCILCKGEYNSESMINYIHVCYDHMIEHNPLSSLMILRQSTAHFKPENRQNASRFWQSSFRIGRFEIIDDVCGWVAKLPAMRGSESTIGRLQVVKSYYLHSYMLLDMMYISPSISLIMAIH